ncbi:hypothetical protein FW320_30735 [Azospirillum sp. Vi22]|nr:hypothetical protein [Azospirillum baldaniorum]
MERHLSSKEKIAVTAGRLTAIIDAKPAGYFYPIAAFSGPGFLNFSAEETEKVQRVLVKAALPAILEQLAAGTYVRKAGVDLQAHTSYGNWNGPGLANHSTGQMDGSGDLITQLLAQRTAVVEGWTFDRLSDPQFDGVRRFLATSFDELPPFATNTDIPSVWNQQARKAGQWDGSVWMPFWRNLAAQLPIIADPAKVDLHNSGISANFLHGLPPAPYPFDVDMARAARGEGLFRDHCQVCHKPLNDSVYGFRSLGTDMNRASVLNGPALAMLLGGFSASCNMPGFKYAQFEGQMVEPCAMNGTDIIADRTKPDAQGYLASVLDGIWARAPYLHNGSVPTLRHLLIPQERPKQFLRGAIEYDQANVGWVWQLDQAGWVSDAAPTLMVFDATRDGASNAGHDRDLVVDGALRRLDWSRPEHAEALKDLLEYLKTQ